MTDLTPDPAHLGPEAEAPEPRRRFLLARLATALRRQDWVTVLVEIVIVIVGVVIGFQVTAWGQGRADRAQEQVYLRQLAEDLRETLSDAEQASERQRATIRAASTALRAYRAPGTPPLDSLRVWIGESFDFVAPTPVLGTAQGIVTSGALSVLRDDSLRVALPSYVEQSREQRESIQVSVDLYAGAFSRLLYSIDAMEGVILVAPPATLDSLALADAAFPVPPGERSAPFPTTSGDILADREVYSALTTAWIMNTALLRYQSGVADRAEEMLRLVERARGESRGLARSDSTVTSAP